MVNIYHKVVRKCSVFSVVSVLNVMSVSMVSVESQKYNFEKQAFISAS